jgi:hypothetical protein
MKVSSPLPALGLVLLLSPFLTMPLNATPDLFHQDNLVAWCIVPYDNQERTPLERAQMLNRLGISRLAWDWRAKHVPLLEEEIQVLRDHDIHLDAVWIWLDQPDYANTFGEANDTLIRTVGEAGVSEVERPI